MVLKRDEQNNQPTRLPGVKRKKVTIFWFFLLSFFFFNRVIGRWTKLGTRKKKVTAPNGRRRVTDAVPVPRGFKKNKKKKRKKKRKRRRRNQQKKKAK